TAPSPTLQFPFTGHPAESPDFLVERLEIGNESCPNGGVRITLGSQVEIVCSGADGTPPSSDFPVVPKARLQGQIQTGSSIASIATSTVAAASVQPAAPAWQ